MKYPETTLHTSAILSALGLAMIIAPTALAADTAATKPGTSTAVQPGSPLQAGPLAQAPFLAAALSEVFTDSRPFSATAVLQLPGDSPSQGLPLGFATLNGSMRWYMNLDQVRTSRLEPEMLNLLRDAKLSQMLLIMRPQTNAILAVPGMRQWFEFSPPTSEQLVDKAREKVGFLQKTEVAREVVEGHPCVKYRLSLPKDRSTGEEAFVWQATDMKNFPIKFQTVVNGENVTLTFRQIREASPDPKHFEPPAGYTKGGGMDALMQRVMMGAMSGLNGLGLPGSLPE